MSWKVDPTHIGHLILQNLATDPEAVGQIDADSGARETKGSMRTRCVKFAMHMTKMGLRTGDVIVVCTNNNNDTFLPLAAAMLLVVAYNAVDLRMAKGEYIHMLKITRPSVIFSDESRVPVFEEVLKKVGLKAEIVIFGDVNNKNYKNVKEFYDNDYDISGFVPTSFDTSKTLSLIVCSSGTTGFPKGGCHTHKSFAKHLLTLGLSFKGVTVCQFSSNYWVTGVLVALFSLAVSAVKVNALPFSPDRFYDYMEKYKCTAMAITPAAMRLIILDSRFESADLKSLKVLLVAGAPGDIDDMKLFQTRISGLVASTYGLSETGGPIAYTPPGTKPRYGSIGIPLPFVQVKLIDVETKEEITDRSRPGELYIKSEYFMTQYYKDPVNTEQAFDKDGWFITGDLTRIDEDGYIYIMDRLKEVIKCKGYSIRPSQVEAVLNTLPGVLESVIVGIDNKETNQMPVAFVKRKPGAKVTAGEVKQLVKESFGFYTELDGGVVFVDSFPMTASGKPKRNALKEMYKTAKVEHE